MRYIFILFILPQFVFAQIPNIFRIDSLPQEGILLDKGWTWHTGDNPEWAKNSFDDSKWESIDPSSAIPELKPDFTNHSLWLRLKFKNSNNRQSLILSIKQSGATEIYLNNYIIQSFGTIDTLNKSIISYDPNDNYITLPLDTADNILAIRYYFEKGLKYKSVFDVRYPLFSARAFSERTEVTSDKNKSAFIWEGVNIGVPLILFIVHFILFLFYTPVRANLWYSLWALCSAIGAYILLQIKLEHHIAFKNDDALYAAIITGLGNLSLTYSLLLLLRQQVKKWLIAFLILTLISFIAFLSESYLSFAFSLLAAILFSLFTIYIGYTAFKQGNIGGKYVMYTMLLYIIIWTLFIFSFDIFNIGWIADVLFHMALFCLPIMISILLGLDTRNIHNNFVNVTLEKQQLLENQNQVLEKEVTERTAALNQTLLNLQSTQAQLIQSEKMASLGELTAGIAHEIQNPLNFVNNFSELNTELIDEIIVDRSKKMEERSDKLQDELISNIKENSEKINQHGQRASSIVKGMLEHSRKSSGEKEPTDINKLCDEFIRLSFHGLRAKENIFPKGMPLANCDYKLDLDPNLPLVNVVSQDIGRVLLNIVNNAFQACNEKSNNLAGLTRMNENNNLRGLSNIDENNNPASPAGRLRARLNDTVGQGLSNINENINLASLSLPSEDDTNLADSSSAQAISNLQDYLPTVIVSTKNLIDKIEIRISDNGPGIPAQIKDKIFQPFFTTKPTGQGTGLGLSLAYDIVKAHGGEIKVDSSIGNGSEFKILLPIS